MTEAQAIIGVLLEDGDELGGVDPKEYADRTLNAPPEYTEALNATLDAFCEQVRADHTRMLKDGVHRILATDKGWRRRFPDKHNHSRLLAQAVTVRRAGRFINNYAEDREVRSMRKIIDDWLRFA